MNSIERYDRLCAEVDRLKALEERTKGGVAQLLKRLKEEHGCEGLLQAKRKVEKLGKEAETLEKRAGKVLDRLESTNES